MCTCGAAGAASLQPHTEWRLLELKGQPRSYLKRSAFSPSSR